MSLCYPPDKKKSLHLWNRVLGLDTFWLESKVTKMKSLPRPWYFTKWRTFLDSLFSRKLAGDVFSAVTASIEEEEAADTRSLALPTRYSLSMERSEREETEPSFLENVFESRRDCGATETVLMAAISIVASDFFSLSLSLSYLGVFEENIVLLLCLITKLCVVSFGGHHKLHVVLESSDIFKKAHWKLRKAHLSLSPPSPSSSSSSLSLIISFQSVAVKYFLLILQLQLRVKIIPYLRSQFP